MLAMHPEYQQRVFEEIRDIFPEQDNFVTAEEIAKLEYTDRFIKETLRLIPTVPLVGKCAKEDVKIGKFLSLAT